VQACVCLTVRGHLAFLSVSETAWPPTLLCAPVRVALRVCVECVQVCIVCLKCRAYVHLLLYMRTHAQMRARSCVRARTDVRVRACLYKL
jgi:hypothetical protein